MRSLSLFLSLVFFSCSFASTNLGAAERPEEKSQSAGAEKNKIWQVGLGIIGVSALATGGVSYWIHRTIHTADRKQKRDLKKLEKERLAKVVAKATRPKVGKSLKKFFSPSYKDITVLALLTLGAELISSGKAQSAPLGEQRSVYTVNPLDSDLESRVHDKILVAFEGNSELGTPSLGTQAQGH